MGRPLNKRFFDPVPASNGEGVASVTVTAGGSYTAVPTATFDAPELPGGTTATSGDVRMGGVSATVQTSGTGAANASYAPGDILTLVGATGTAATFDVATTTARTFGVDTMGTTVWTTGDTITFGPGGGWDVAAVVTVTAAAGAITGTSNIVPGTYSGASDLQAVAPTSTSVADGGGYQNDSLFNLGMGVATVTLADAGDMTAIPVNPAATTTDSDSGTGATLTVTYEVIGVDVADSGSGYVAAPGVTFSAGAATADGVLTTTGTNVILAKAFVVGGSAALDADIIKQTSTNEYVMVTTEGESIVTLVASDTPTEGQASITATDALGETYWVMKLTARLAVLEQKVAGAGVYESGETAPWSLEATSVDPFGQTVQITSA